MEIVFVRHGVPDYALADERKMSQLEKDYAPLHRDYIRDIKALASDPVFNGSTVIVSSPYTRALQTAEILNRQFQLDLFIEHDLREWQADVSGGYIDIEERDRRWFEYRDHLKQGTVPEDVSYEQHEQLRTRALRVLGQYLGYKKVIVVSHFNVLESLLGFQEKGIGCGQYQYFSYERAIAGCSRRERS
ncbi:histidine phosphatase family protein [Photobacterium sp. MCCC 1A19761]|uniref:histidine phosphatase family protein n=1 Tax=Photobacterium sp. MCCC 1A19761 TaxID=3115000 RepID=UPI00307DEA91